MKNKTKQFVAFIMAILFLTTSSLTTFANTDTENQLENIIVTETENQTVIAQVPKKHVEEYKEKLKDPDFKQQQIDMMLNTNQDTKALPEGRIMAQRYLYRSDIKRIYESVKPGAFESLVLSFGPSAAVSKIIKPTYPAAWLILERL